MAERATFEIDITEMTRLVASQLVTPISRGAAIVDEEVSARIQQQAEPSKPGEFPASPTGKYLRSWQHTPAVIYDDAVVAYAFSPAEHSDGFPLALALDEGRDDIAPRPHIDAAMAAAERRIEALVRRAEGDLGE